MRGNLARSDHRVQCLPPGYLLRRGERQAAQKPLGRLSFADRLCRLPGRPRPEKRTLALYREEIYAALGYLDRWDHARDRLLGTFRDHGFDISQPFIAWTRGEPFMHSPNHPRIHCLRDVACGILARAGLEASYLASLPHDNLANGPIYPVYPRSAHASAPTGLPVQARRHIPIPEARGLSSRMLRSVPFESGYGAEQGIRPQAGKSGGGRRGSAMNPYHDLEPHHFWRRAVSGVERFPSTRSSPPGSRSNRSNGSRPPAVASPSTFQSPRAQRIQLQVAEAGEGLPTEQRKARNYGVFSCRYGNIYTSRQLLQLFQAASKAGPWPRMFGCATTGAMWTRCARRSNPPDSLLRTMRARAGGAPCRCEADVRRPAKSSCSR